MLSNVDLKDRGTYGTWATDVIRYNDLDPNGHVNNGAINMFFEDGRVMFRDAHFKTQVGEVLTGFVLAKYTVEYHRPVHFPGAVDIGTTIIRIGGSSYSFGQGIFKQTECFATAEVVQVRIDPATGRSAPLSGPFKALLEQQLAKPARAG
jgi:acyl-CoA thioester hydrolase